MLSEVFFDTLSLEGLFENAYHRVGTFILLIETSLNIVSRWLRSFPAISWLSRFISASYNQVVLDIFDAVQILAVGFIILLFSPERLSSYWSIIRTLMVGLIAIALSTMIYRAWQPVSNDLLKPVIPAPRRAIQAAAAVISAFLVIGILRDFLGEHSTSPAPLILWASVSGLLAAALQFVSNYKTRVVIVGDSGPAHALSRQLVGMDKSLGVLVLAIIDANDFADLTRLCEIASDGLPDAVIIPAGADDKTITTVCSSLADFNIRVRLALAAGPVSQSPFMRVSGPPPLLLIDLLPPPLTGWRRAGKRCFDVLIALLLLPILAPLLLIVAIAIRLESPGPALFRQWRFGQNGRQVMIFKFRTMRVEAGDTTGVARTQARDPRVTRVGRVLRRLSIDEIPQLLNVLRGEMSLVGPRPHVIQMQVEGVSYAEAVQTYRARHRMLPGITGWAQVNGSRGEVDTLEKAQRRIELDLWYVANWSPLLDMWIIVLTAIGGFVTLRAD